MSRGQINVHSVDVPPEHSRARAVCALIRHQVVQQCKVQAQWWCVSVGVGALGTAQATRHQPPRGRGTHRRFVLVAVRVVVGVVGRTTAIQRRICRSTFRCILN
jgi:hypothetical protein